MAGENRRSAASTAPLVTSENSFHVDAAAASKARPLAARTRGCRLATDIARRAGALPVCRLIAGAPWAILMSVVLYFLVRFLLPAETDAIPGGKEAVQRELSALGPMTAPQKRLAAVSVGLLLFWATEGKLHSFDTATVTFVGLGILMLPRIGVMDWKTMQQRTPWGTLIVFGVGISLGTALLSTQAGQWLGKFVVAHSGLATQGPVMVFAILAAFLILIHLGFVSATALTAAMLPILISVLQTLPGASTAWA